MDVKAASARRKMLPAEPALPAWIAVAFDDANTAVGIFDATGKALYFNDEMKALSRSLGHAEAMLADLAPSDRTSAGFVDFERFRAGRIDRMQAQYQLHHEDGRSYWADLSARRLPFEPGQSPLILFQIVDITAAREARTEMARNNARWEAMLGAARQGVWDHDSRRGTVVYSRTWRCLRGIPEDEEVDGRRELWLARLHPDDRQRIESVVHRQETGEDGYDTLEYRERHRDGHYVWILSRGKPIEWDADGNPVRTVGTDTDITRLKTIEAELALEKGRLQVTLQSIADGVISTDHQGRITFINEAAEKMTGWSVDAALGQGIETVFDSRLEAEPDKPANLVQQCLKRGKTIKAPGYTLIKRAGGRACYLRETASPVLGEDGSVTGAVMVFHDSTRRRKLVRKLEYTASHDALTDLDNRASFEIQLEASVQSAKAGAGPHTLCLIDLDHFKTVNDGAGHSAGDALLREVARLLRDSCRQGDCVARLGGDEFAIILENCSLKTARKIAQKIVRRVDALRFGWQGESFAIGASIGITAIDEATFNAMELYRNADNACYAAKRNGRGCVVVFS